MNLFCCLFDENFSARGLALSRSLVRHAPRSRLAILCLDAAALRAASALAPPGTELMTLDELEARDPDLAGVRPTRTLAEYHLTCVPAFTLHLLETRPAVESVVYLDADLYLFSDPSEALAEAADAPAALTPQDASLWLGYREETGRYNDGWTHVRNCAEGRSLLRWWRQRCLEWCHDRIEPGRYTEQKYLDEWPLLQPDIKELSHPGVNLGPWNVGHRALSSEGTDVFVDGRALVAYHFSGVSRVAGPLYQTRLGDYGVRAHGLLRERVYAPYLRELHALEGEVSLIAGAVVGRASRVGFDRPRGWRFWRLAVRGALRGQYMLARQTAAR